MSTGLRTAPDARERAAVEDLVGDLPGEARDRAFNEPWEIRVFGLAVAAHKAGRFEWSQFQAALVESIDRWEKGNPELDHSSWSYYEHWTNALEIVLGEEGLLDPASLIARTDEVLATPANRNHHEPHREPVAVEPARA
jgi:nitrile hydratase accessory protein